MEILDLNLARHRPGRRQLEAGRKTEVLEPFMELVVPYAGVRPVARIWRPWPRREMPGPAGPEFLEKVASRPWPVQELDQLRQEAAALTPARPAQDSPTLTLTGYLLPGSDLTEALGKP